ncbi:YfkD famly protein [Bacillus massiliglaciei]|uniref:YfkD famly protein n=1 Tax=Bacillus massiliglaciei TaxID=1816693 RepID=UPI000AC8E89E|nr:YfkD famly protein [Bacillus massiliglaciei]
MKRLFMVSVILVLSLLHSENVLSAKSVQEKVTSAKMTVPPSVLNIAKENTYPNPTQDLPLLQPSKLAKQLLETADIKIENPELVHMLNESAISKSPLSFLGNKATIYLGHWALNYESTETAPNWEYQKINTNFFDNRGGISPHKLHYVQESQKTVRGGLTAKIPAADDVQKMMLLKATEKTNLPLAFETIVGSGTKKDQVYNIPPKRLGYLYSYASAVNEKGKVTYGEVYLNLRGSKRALLIKNVTSQGIGAWIPVQDHLAFSFTTSQLPR